MNVNDPLRIDAIARVLSLAFYRDPLFCYFFPDDSRRLAQSRHTFLFLARHAQHRGEICTPPGSVDGAALWLPSDALHRSVMDMLRFGALPMLRQGPAAVKRQLDAGDAMQKVHDGLMSKPHAYLLLLGIDPQHQGRGLATRLLEPTLERLDREGLPAYLDTHNPDNVSLYRRFGFEVVHEAPMPGTKVRHWAMVRGNR
ncbi:GNAT family N-acetyltransferase [Alcanivorax sp.]|jgi:ribosomal protein S18 acetylase RimI-like enzyme|uniref:GNAT family N-acetyltransferase n=1 Tax=Alcanivorax sp. TaxID=1872427 RepID=UPI003BAA626D